jgi:membrane-bound serine protease (ClpP class)
MAAAGAIVALGALLGLAEEPSSPAPRARPLVTQLRLRGSISPAAVDYIREGIARSKAEGAAALIIELDTPGGLLASTRTIVQDLLASPVPVIAYVAPSGSGAGSAGVFVVMAANVAAMAPGTNIGASTPVEGGGGDIPGEMGKKVKSFTASFAKAIAEQRGRNVKWAAKAVRKAESATDREALELGVIDIVAVDVADLLAQANGREVTIDGERRALDVAGASIVEIDMTLRQRVLSFLADPNVAYLFLMAGLLGLYLELSHPGTLLPGVTGAICLLVALASFQILPINVTGVALLVVGAAMLVAELFLPSFGIIGVGGLIAFVLGSLFLFDPAETGLAIDRRLIGSAAAAVGLVMLVLAGLVARSMRQRSTTGREGLMGLVGEARTRLAPGGTVFVQGELWRARADRTVEAGAPVRIVAVVGLTLRVEPAEGEGGEP